MSTKVETERNNRPPMTSPQFCMKSYYFAGKELFDDVCALGYMPTIMKCCVEGVGRIHD